MHKYLKAIGFSNKNSKKDVNKLIHEIIEKPDIRELFEDKDGTVYAQLTKEFSDNIGFTICGEYGEDDKFEMEYYYPYLKGSLISSREEVVVEKHSDKESYAGICEEFKVGVSLIFYLLNFCEYKNELRIQTLSRNNNSLTLSGLSLSGRIILPINKSESQVRYTKEASQTRNQLIAEARKGDEDAIESLTLEDIDTYTMISRRILKEDVFSLVDSYFMPYGVECDKYSVMGEIKEFYTTENKVTGEELFVLTIDSNELLFNICINKKDLLGEPEIGRRFKGIIWLQGNINFEK